VRPLLPLLAGLSVVAAGGCGAPSGPSEAPRQSALSLSLHPGTVAEAALAGGGSQVYSFSLPPGQFAELAVEQQGIDAVVRLGDSAGRRLTEVDSPNGLNGPETLLLLGDEAPSLRLTVASTDRSAAPGRFTIRVTGLHRATDHDRARVAAERTFAQAEILRGQGGGEALGRAVAEQEKALAAFRALGDHRREADALDRLGRVQIRRGDMEAAHAAYRRALPLLRALGTRQETLDALNGLGTAARSLGRPEEALAAYREAREIVTDLRDRTSEAKIWTNIGRALAETGDAEEAFQAYDRALAIWRSLGNRGEEGGTLGNMGRLYASLGEPERARDTLERAAVWLEEAGSLREAGSMLTQLGMARALAGQPREGLAAAERALLIQRKAGDREGEAVALSTLGWLHDQAGAPAEARRCLLQALALSEELGARTEEAAVLTHLGQVALRQRHTEEALALLERALPLLAASGDRRKEAEVLYDQAVAWRQAGKLAMAFGKSEEALARIEALRVEPVSNDLRAAFLASRQDLYELSIDLLLDLHQQQPAAGYAARAFATSEQAKVRTLLDVLSRDDSGADPALVAEEGEVVRRLAAAGRRQQRLETGGAPAAEQAEARAAFDALLRARERLAAEMDAAARPAAFQPLGAAEIQRQAAAPGQLLLAYALGRKRSVLWAIEPHRLDVFELPPRGRIEDAARRAHALLASPDRTLAAPRTEEALAELSGVLLGPVADRLAGQRLLIVPDGALAYVPFAALPAPGAPAGSRLVETHEIVLLPSASSLVLLRHRAASPPPGLLAVVADPVFEPDDPRLTREPAAPPRATLRAGDPALSLPRLPFSREEAAAILRLAPPGRRFAALDFAASRDTVLGGVLSGYRLLHFATHAVIDPQHPALSGIALSRVDPQGRRREGFLRASEIRHLRLPADLVVLSACRTALGKEVRGEGLLGLTQSFFQAGARRVLVSLWPVDDRATAELMARFYRALLTEGRSPAAALRAAQLSLRREPLYQSPAFWAGFVLQGDV